jgi:hypothetical protein
MEDVDVVLLSVVSSKLRLEMYEWGDAGAPCHYLTNVHQTYSILYTLCS